MKKLFGVLNLLLVLLVFAGGVYYDRHGTLSVKATASSLFVLLGAVNFAYALLRRAGRGYSAVMLAGLVFAMAGDVLLGRSFKLGAGMFAAGHVLYFVSYCCVEKLKCRDMLIGLVIAAVSVLLLHFGKMFRFRSAIRKEICMEYAAVISLMVGKAIGNFAGRRTAARALMAVGSAMFFFSDLMLALRMFGSAPRLAGSLCLLTYYPAQALLAYAVYHEVNKRAEIV